ncbi:hypothetical protein IFM51744_06785 [Aspergillus udagawae]|uniref:C2H2-type domain-containing protein n=1 Tax=Aspergillus udagawae TaxID=91492 RepID=A0ABQ1A6G1_9EURO|nr:hypothetical protein IFM51744_06785 [Aspergillus udagawae]GFF74730.1 hypothetical protein IFM53868_01398 [Aspergillus udagawae]
MQSSALSRPVGRRRPKTSKQERVCPICSKEFSKAEHLARHYRSHTKEKPFHCVVCGRVYTRQDTLLRHTRSHCRRDELGVVANSPEGRAPGLEELTAATSQPVPTLSTWSNIRRPSNALPQRVDTATVPIESDTNASPALNFPISLNLNPGADFHVNGGLNSTDIHSVELEPGWISWLMGENFDLDAVNSSLLQATTGELLPVDLMPDEDPIPTDSFNVGPHATDAGLALTGDTIREKWHTHCGQTTSGVITPDPTKDRNQIDESYRHELANRLQQRVQPGTLPSTTFLHLCLQAYFSHFHPIFPIIHEPSFLPSRQNAVLLLSICSVGSLFLGSQRAIEHGISMFERLQKAVLSSWDIMIAQRSDSNIVAIQSALLGQTFGLLMGRPKDLAGIETFHGSIIAWARRVRLLNHATSPALPQNLPNLTNGQLQSAWEHWISAEERKRTVLGIFILDAELAKIHHHEPYLRPATPRLPTISSDDAFAANNASAWKELVHQQIQKSGSRTPLPNVVQEQRPGGTSDFELCAMLESISAVACERQEPLSTTPHLTEKCQEMLITWYETHLSTSAPGQVSAYPLRILWHSTFIVLYSNLDVLERACGRDGPEAAQEAIGCARTWANSHEATRSLVHAVYVRNYFESMSIGSACPLHVPISLYHCGIIWFCFGHFGNSSNKPIIGRNFPELDLVGVNVDEINAAELRNFRVERNAANQVFRIVGLLQSIRHGKLSSSLASTLLALIEEQDNVF